VRFMSMAAIAAAFFASQAAASGLVWQIGVADDSFSDFALAPNKYADFESGPVYVIGQSEPRKDWPYVHPGPLDGWAGSKPHRFVILFGLDQRGEGPSLLKIGLVDTHGASPPQLNVSVNGFSFPCQTPPGAGSDATIKGDPRGGKAYEVLVPIPAGRLNKGTNKIVIENVAGSWMLYDWIGFEAAEGSRAGAVQSAFATREPVQAPALVMRDGKLMSLLRMEVFCAGDEPQDVSVRVGDAVTALTLQPGNRTVEMAAPAVGREERVAVEIVANGAVAASHTVRVRPVRKWEVYLLPHSHVDIGYTHVQDDVERMQADHIRNAIAAARQTADYPEGAQFKWNTEVQWPVEKFLERAGEDEVRDFVEAAKKGWLGIDALYANQLTALSRPEELARLVQHAQMLRDRFGLEIDSAMITDVPGYTWGIVPVLAQSGVKYWSIGPNFGHRIGHTLSEWGDRPFYWVSPSGAEKVLVWVASYGYSAFHSGVMRDGGKVWAFLKDLEKINYPYEIAHMRYSIGGDNGPPDPGLSDFVKGWNERYAYPKLRIAMTGELFHAFEARYGDSIPAVRGDFTPYWEDGAASSALETGLVREAAERMAQAEVLWVTNRLGRACPRELFNRAWNNSTLYNEHTWGAHNSISEPDAEFVKQQWEVKRQFALDAADLAEKNLAAAAGIKKPDDVVNAVQVFNTNSWDRTDLVTLPALWKRAGDRVVDEEGRVVLSQRLSDGSLAFLASGVPAFGSRKYLVEAGDAKAAGDARADGFVLSNGAMTVELDPSTGALARITCNVGGREIVSPEKGGANAYKYLPGREAGDVVGNSGARVVVKEAGPLVVSLVAESPAPGARRLSTEYRLISGMDYLEILNLLDKEAVRTKESVHFGFNFNVPDGVVRMDTPWAVVRPEADQLPGSCKNYFTVQRWVDVSNQDYGVTWTTVDAPLVELGQIRVDGPFVRRIMPSQSFYSYVMNNYWETNYKADQEGQTPFRYRVRPHGRFSPEEAARFGIQTSQPLVMAPVEQDAPVAPPLLRVEPSGVLVSGLKISEDGKAVILRLFGASGKPETARIVWSESERPRVWLSDLSEKPLERVEETVEVPAWGMVTLRAGNVK